MFLDSFILVFSLSDAPGSPPLAGNSNQPRHAPHSASSGSSLSGQAAVGLAHAIGRHLMQPSGSHTPLAGVSCRRRARTRHWQAFHADVGLAHAIG
ncbi:hypothetical protein AMECASPLE_037050, partial [Ameca splendens]